MAPYLTTAESYDWLRSTLEDVASIPRLTDEDFSYTVFEVLDADVRAALSEVALERCVSSHPISESAIREILNLRSGFLVLVNSACLAKSSSLSQIRCDERWLDVARSAQKILKDCLHDNAA